VVSFLSGKIAHGTHNVGLGGPQNRSALGGEEKNLAPTGTEH
jgi:hypothetical protein